MPADQALPVLVEPWASFLSEVDTMLDERVQIHCLGGFVVTVLHRVPRATRDIDYVEVIPREFGSRLEEIAGMESALAKRYGLYLQRVGVADLPEDYDTRLTDAFPGRFSRLQILALDVYDVILGKLTRNHRRDRDDVQALASMLGLSATVLRERYEREMRPWIPNAERHDLTIKLWVEEFFEKPETT